MNDRASIAGRRLAAHRYLYESAGGSFRRELTVDDNGFVLDYRGLWSLNYARDMTPLADSVLSIARRFFSVDYLPKIERCLASLDEADVWWRANPASNSIGNLVLHLEGSTRMWITGVAGGRPVTRDRAAEFAERGPIAKDALLARLRATMSEVDEVLATLDANTLLERRKSSREEVTVLWAILHAVEHFAMHTGQIIVLTKQRTAADLQLRK